MIEKIIDEVTSELIPSTGLNLKGMDIDICYFFDNKDELKFISRKKTGDNRCMFQINLEATEKAETLQDVTMALSKCWHDIMYSYFEKSSIQKYKDKMILRFVTVIGENEFYVTGQATVAGEHYRKLSEDFKSS